ncbi:EAL domain-containing protein [Massilia agilis]|uniref:Diguanylate cyclase DosC n=1 Tax=Massilia agilis TaxID=1811226 RepID=A0ABT2D8E3_9BURK|nr:EAL domain-containing protein [Massilia agilis]MCS0807413.1 EAL domain-containing protein [Massilia agilis]
MKDLREAVLQVAREIGLTDEEIARRKDFLELTAHDCELLRDVQERIAHDRESFADTFYEHVLSFSSMRALVPTQDAQLRLQHAMGAYFASLCSGDYGPDYVAERLRVGLTHQRIGLEPKWYIGAYRKYLGELVQILGRQLGDDPQYLLAACNAVLKVVCFDMGLALDTYFHASQRSILEKRAYLEQVIDGMPAGLVVLGRDLRVLSINRTMADMLGVPDDALEGQPPLASLLGCSDLEQRALAVLEHGTPLDHVLCTIDGGADGVRYLEFNIRRTEEGGAALLLLIGQDITFRRRARLRLQESEEYFRLTFTQAAVGMAHIARDGRLMRVNRKLRDILGYGEAELLQQNWIAITHPEDAGEDAALMTRLAEGRIGEYTREKRFVRRDGRALWVASSMSVMRDAAGTQRFIAVVEDISRRKQAEEALLRMANHDALTGLPNRVLLQDRLAQAIAHAQRSQRQVGVVFVDLDRFKLINDSLGHDAGDQLIVEIAQRLSGSLRESDTVARQGGDEFVVVLADLGGEDDAAKVATKLLASLFQPLTLAGQEVFPTGSMGIAMYPRDGQDSQALLKSADSAMYRAKALGGNHFRFYNPSLDAQSLEALRMEGALQRALQRNEFEVLYQPLVAVDGGAIAGVEALLRWKRDTGTLLPHDFLALAEETGLIVPIGEWVLSTVLAQQAAWRAAGLPRLRVSVNLSARQFHDQDLAAQVARLAREAGCELPCLGLEVAESVLAQDAPGTLDTMRKLAAMGVLLSIDDFGSGYSSLANLRRFPIHSLKVDRSFVSDITSDRDDAQIVKAVIALAHSLKLLVVAEGVENEAQVAVLREQGCDLMQGYYHSAPMTASQFEALLRRGAHEAAAA